MATKNSKLKSNSKFTKTTKTTIMLIAGYVLLPILIISNLLIIFTKSNSSIVSASDVSNYSLEIDSDYLETLVRQNPDYMPGWLRLAEVYAEQGNIHNALIVLEYAKLLDPNSEELLIIEKKILNR